MIVLSDVAQMSEPEEAALIEWVEQGGLLLRFAGPRMAASDLGRDTEDTLLPARLRSGGRSVGGAMSWGEAKTLAPFPESSPFLARISQRTWLFRPKSWRNQTLTWRIA